MDGCSSHTLETESELESLRQGDDGWMDGWMELPYPRDRVGIRKLRSKASRMDECNSHTLEPVGIRKLAGSWMGGRM
jgi:hypothetical protein